MINPIERLPKVGDPLLIDPRFTPETTLVQEIELVEREVLLDLTRSRLLKQTGEALKANQGLAFYRAELTGGDISLLVTNRAEVTSDPGALVVCINIDRPSDSQSGAAKGDRVLDMLDIVFRGKSSWLNVRSESRPHNDADPNWPLPQTATLMIEDESKVSLVGNLATRDFVPQPLITEQSLASDKVALSKLYDHLKICIPGFLIDEVTDVARVQ